MKRAFISNWLVAPGLALFCITLKSCIPAKSNRSNTETKKGRVIDITTCCPGGDIIFHLNNDEGASYYINRGEEAGLIVANLKKELLNKDITISYIATHICELRTDDSVYYTELVD